jgi:glycosyltransferase involved in cell wall biosynthesis
VLISILIPTRNRLGYLRASLASALAQEGVEIEVIVSDDGSVDGTADYVQSVAATDARLRLSTANPTPGIFENVEHLIAAASGEAFTILSDDDLLDAEFCRRLSEPMDTDPRVVLTFCDHRTIDAQGRLKKRATREISRQYGRAMLAEGPLAAPEMVALQGGIWLGFALYRRRVFGSERFDLSCGTAADWDFGIRASQRGRVTYVAAMLGAYRDHGGTASRMGLRNESELAIRVLSKHTMQDAGAELTRKHMLRAAAKRNAYQMAAFDRVAARRSLGLYSALGGGAWSVHILAAKLILVLPRPIARWTRASLSFVASGVRTLRRVATLP